MIAPCIHNEPTRAIQRQQASRRSDKQGHRRSCVSEGKRRSTPGVACVSRYGTRHRFDFSYTLAFEKIFQKRDRRHHFFVPSVRKNLLTALCLYGPGGVCACRKRSPWAVLAPPRHPRVTSSIAATVVLVYSFRRKTPTCARSKNARVRAAPGWGWHNSRINRTSPERLVESRAGAMSGSGSIRRACDEGGGRQRAWASRWPLARRRFSVVRRAAPRRGRGRRGVNACRSVEPSRELYDRR